MTTASVSKTPDGPEIIEGLAMNLKLSQELLVALHEESTALRAMDTQGLFRLSRHKDTLLAKIHYLDDALQRSLPAKAPASPALPPEQAHLVGQYKRKISGLRQEILARNLINKRFTEDTLGLLHEAITLISRPPEADNTYHIRGRSQARGRTMPNFISREA
jgi:flagellar biosynthesis/type III secretory pathway chaperone